jgi:hypothetical protein
MEYDGDGSRIRTLGDSCISLLCQNEQRQQLEYAEVEMGTIPAQRWAKKMASDINKTCEDCLLGNVLQLTKTNRLE